MVVRIFVGNSFPVSVCQWCNKTIIGKFAAGVCFDEIVYTQTLSIITKESLGLKDQ